MSSSTVTLLAPAQGAVTAQAALPGTPEGCRPFAPHRREVLAELSRRILHDPFLRRDPASVALGYWLRQANITRQAQAFERRIAAEENLVFVPVGRVFHVAPGNVDTVFVYSWALSYICGNQNVVRVSTDQSEVLSQLLATIGSLMDDDTTFGSENRFLTYPHDRERSAVFSRWASHRVLWGGDEAIAELREAPLQAHASERAFGSKFSYCAIAAAKFLAEPDERIDRLAADFFNDLFWFDQMACSSPHLVVWVGDETDATAATTRFHHALDREIERRGFRGQPSSALHRLNYAFDLACEAELTGDPYQREFLAVRLADGEPWRKEICGAGFFTHVRVDELASVAKRADERDQTVTHFGFSAEELRRFGELAGARGVDRVVPIGEALAFDTTWDGFDLLGDFLRRVAVRDSA